MRIVFCVFILASATSVLAAEEIPPVQEVVVQASLRGEKIEDLPASATVLDASTLALSGVQHFEDVLGLVPNLNWSAGTSRPRFFQLRGIGEVEQYQGAPNPSVGFLIDDIDFSGVGMPATLFDTRQIEVLRGPQGTIYGASAIAGLINVRTEDPSAGFDLKSELTGGGYSTGAVGLAVGDGLDSGTAGWRLVAQRYRSDGFRQNVFLGRDSTNGYDEATLRGKLHWQPSESLQADLTLMHVNIDNGYDAWSIDNTFKTYSNQPGRDAQRSDGAALRIVAALAGLGELRSVTSAADSKIVYSFDDDWGNDTLWGNYAPYDYFQADDRRRRTLAQDVRLVGDPSRALWGRLHWLAGIYALHLSESDDQIYTYDDQYYGAGSGGLLSRYSATNVAVYGSLDTSLGARTKLSAGLRLEQRDAQYSDSADEATPFPQERNRMLGGNLSWMHRLTPARNVYVTLARGYKAGGFNIGSQILSEQRGFGPEHLWSLESGLKYAREDGGLELTTDVFYMRRRNMQVYLSQQLQQNNPLAYVFFTQNASDGENYGLEAESSYRLNERWRISGSASLLRTRYLGVGGLFGSLGIDGRAQPFAPGYKLSLGLDYRHPTGWFARLDASALDSFYYYTSYALTSKAYNLENIRVGYAQGPWTASVWVRNVFNARYAQQGFYFGLIPPDYTTQSFLQLGDPRQVGVTLNYSLR